MFKDVEAGVRLLWRSCIQTKNTAFPSIKQKFHMFLFLRDASFLSETTKSENPAPSSFFPASKNIEKPFVFDHMMMRQAVYLRVAQTVLQQSIRRHILKQAFYFMSIKKK